MRDLFTGRLRALTQSPDGLLHDAQPPPSIGVAAAQIGMNGQPLVEPGAFFCDGNYALAINSWNALVGVAVTVRLRWLGADGRTTDSEFVHTPNSNRTKATSNFPLGVGFALNVTVFASTGAPLVGQTFIQVQIVRGLTGALLPVATLLQDYVTAVQAVAWPGSPIRSSIEGGGVPRTITGTQPAAGAELSETVPAGARWQLRAFTVQLNCSAAVANRQPTLRLNSGGGLAANCVVTTAETASQTGLFTWAPGMPLCVIAAWPIIQGSSPIDFLLLAAGTIGSLTSGIQAGDQFLAPIYLVTEWLEAAA